MSDLKKTQHFTENYKEILQGIDFYPQKTVDPFAGNRALFKYSPNTDWEFYDIDVKVEGSTTNCSDKCHEMGGFPKGNEDIV